MIVGGKRPETPLVLKDSWIIPLARRWPGAVSSRAMRAATLVERGGGLYVEGRVAYGTTTRHYRSGLRVKVASPVCSIFGIVDSVRHEGEDQVMVIRVSA